MLGEELEHHVFQRNNATACFSIPVGGGAGIACGFQPDEAFIEGIFGACAFQRHIGVLLHAQSIEQVPVFDEQQFRIGIHLAIALKVLNCFIQVKQHISSTLNKKGRHI